MSKRLSEVPLTTAKARARLEPGEYARRLDADSALWYRKGARGGSWFARWRNWGPGAAYRQKPIGAANDENDKPADGLWIFDQAERAARAIVAEARAEAKAAEAGPILTVCAAVEAYSASRDARDSARAGRPVRSDARTRLERYVVGAVARGKRTAIEPSPLAGVAVHALAETNLQRWRAALPADMKATTRQRLINDLKAALNASYAVHRAKLSAELPGIIKHGLRSIDNGDDREPVARENQILTDAEVARIVDAARDVDAAQGWDGDLFRMVLVLAATGARFSQIARMRVSDLQTERERLLVPLSRKGRGGKAGSITVPVGRDVLEALAPAAEGRAGDAYLLERWRRKQTGIAEWVREKRGPWQSSSELVRPWDAIVVRAKLPKAIPYALRHSSIVRGIKANLPLRLVAAMHDTSTAMIERHYSKWITTGLEDMARGAIVPLIKQPRTLEIVTENI